MNSHLEALAKHAELERQTGLKGDDEKTAYLCGVVD